MTAKCLHFKNLNGSNPLTKLKIDFIINFSFYPSARLHSNNNASKMSIRAITIAEQVKKRRLICSPFNM